MVAFNDKRVARRAPGSGFGYPVLGGVRIFGGTFVGITAAGFAVPAGHADAVVLHGISEERIDNRDGEDGALTVEVEEAVIRYPVDGADISNKGDPVYALDDETLQLTNVGGELQAGTIKTVDAEGVWVELT